MAKKSTVNAPNTQLSTAKNDLRSCESQIQSIAGATQHTEYILGIDPGLASLGWGVIAIEKVGFVRSSHTTTKQIASTASRTLPRQHTKKQVLHIAHGVIETLAKESLGNRLLHIERSIDAIFARYNITTMVYEQQFFVKNVTSGIQVAHALGVILLYAAKQALPVVSFTPREIKQQITGSAAAQKETLEQFICRELDLDTIAIHHASDALGAALSYYYKSQSSIITNK